MESGQRIILIGFMASGKSAVATRLAELLRLPLRQMDDEIIEASGLSSISEIFKEHGEARFRELETTVALALRSFSCGIISSGGGVVTRSENRAALVQPGTEVIFLRTTFDTVQDRAGDLSSRPLLRDIENARTLFIDRAPLYEEWATMIVDTDAKGVDEVCQEILGHLQERG
jgi:shikimate kinase